MAARTKQRWRDMSQGRRVAIAVAALAQLALQAAALRDIAQRTPAQVNGSRAGWVAASFINFAGPIAYFVKGRNCEGPEGVEPGRSKNSLCRLPSAG